jgi:integrase
MKGNLTRRGKTSWRLKFDAGRDPATGERLTKYVTLKGTKAQAQAEAAKIIASTVTGEYVDASSEITSQFIERWLADHADHNVGNKAWTRYAELLRKHVGSRVGNIPIQKLQAKDLARVYSEMAKAGLSDRTRLHAHRVMRTMLKHAVQWGVVFRNVADLVDAPRVAVDEVVIPTTEQMDLILAALKGSELYAVVATAIGTGLRRGELCALRWSNVDLESGSLRVVQSLEQSKRGGLVFKAPKSAAGKRTVSLSPSTVAILRTHKREQQERRLALGLGRMPADGFVFAGLDDTMLKPATLTQAWKRMIARLGQPELTLHCLRHYHVSALISAGIDILSVSRRIGHSSAALTLRVYGHLLKQKDDQVAVAIEALFRGEGH